MNVRPFFAFALFLALLCPREGVAQYTDQVRDPGTPVLTSPKLEHVGVSEHLGAKLPLQASFQDERGREVQLGKYFVGSRPVLLIFAYHSCPLLCSMVLDAAVKGLKAIEWKLGQQYEVVVVSIDPADTLERANRKRSEVLDKYGKTPESESGLHFLLGDEENISQVAERAGLQFEYDPTTKQYGHPAVVMLLTPTGELARYLYGLEYSPNDLKIGLLEASKGNHISTIDQVILYCFMYDDKQSKYVVYARNVMRLGGAVVAMLLISVLAVFWLRERRRSKLLVSPVREESVTGSHSA